jgi:hypothetical protein
MSYDEIGSARFDRSDKWSKDYRKAVKALGRADAGGGGLR